MGYPAFVTVFHRAWCTCSCGGYVYWFCEENYEKWAVWQIQQCAENYYGNSNTCYCIIYVLLKFLNFKEENYHE